MREPQILEWLSAIGPVGRRKLRDHPNSQPLSPELVKILSRGPLQVLGPEGDQGASYMPATVLEALATFD